MSEMGDLCAFSGGAEQSMPSYVIEKIAESEKRGLGKPRRIDMCREDIAELGHKTELPLGCYAMTFLGIPVYVGALDMGDVKFTYANKSISWFIPDALVIACEKRGYVMKYSVSVDVASDSFLVFGVCEQCDVKSEIAAFDATKDFAESHYESVIRQNSLSLRGRCIAEECVDPMDRKVDGMRVQECVFWYTLNQRAADAGRCGARRTLTPAQKDAARTAWSAELRRKQAEAREAERVAIVCDDDRWEE